MNLLILPGDGIGPDIMPAALSVLRAADEQHGLNLSFDQMDVGFASLANRGTTFHGDVEQACRLTDGVVLGPVDHHAYPPRAEGGLNPSGELRVRLDLFANVRPVKTMPGVPHIGKAMDLVIVRENTEGFYADRNMAHGGGEFMPTEDVALAVRKVTVAGSRRIARAAFALASSRRQKVAVVTKSNVLRMSDGLFLREVNAVADAYGEVATEEVLADAMAALLVREPERFDVIVTTNMFGDILSDEAAELAGGLGLAGSLNAGDACAVAQAVHGAAPTLAGTGRANPSALIRSCAMLLDWLAEKDGSSAARTAAKGIHEALDAILANPANHTADLGGAIDTQTFGDRVAAAVLGRNW